MAKGLTKSGKPDGRGRAAASLANLNPIKPGDPNPNPGGKPVGSRNRLQGSFLSGLADDFELHGKKAIIACREKDPATYVRIVASLMPREVEVKHALEELTDDELADAVATIRGLVARQIAGAVVDAGKAGGPARAKESAIDVQAVREAD